MQAFFILQHITSTLFLLYICANTNKPINELTNKLINQLTNYQSNGIKQKLYTRRNRNKME